MYQVILPDAGEGTVESEIVTWFFDIGDEIKEDDILLEMQSDKAIVELPSPVNGILQKKYYEESELAQVGEPVASIEIEGESSGDVEAETEAGEEVAQVSEASSTEKDLVSTKETLDDWRTLAVPRVRIYARDKNVDLTKVEGSGNNGKITIEDINQYLENPQVKADKSTEETSAEIFTEEVKSTQTSKSNIKPYQPSETERSSRADRVEKITPMRRATANAMINSKQVSPHVTVFDQVEVSALVDHRDQMKHIAGESEIRLTYTAYFVKALVAVLKRFPDLNASLNLDAGEIYYHQFYNIGVAVDTPQGLVVPVVKDADRLSLFEIAKEISEMSEQAIEGKLTTDKMKNGSLTVTNVGGAATGGVWSTPIINQPEIAIVGMGRIENTFLPDAEGNPVLKPVLKISFAFDHRAIDGVYAQRAINLLKEYLHNPNLLLSEG